MSEGETGGEKKPSTRIRRAPPPKRALLRLSRVEWRDTFSLPSNAFRRARMNHTLGLSPPFGTRASGSLDASTMLHFDIKHKSARELRAPAAPRRLFFLSIRVGALRRDGPSPLFSSFYPLAKK